MLAGVRERVMLEGTYAHPWEHLIPVSGHMR